MTLCTQLIRFGRYVLLSLVFMAAGFAPTAWAADAPLNELLVRWKHSQSIQRYSVDNAEEALAVLQIDPRVEHVERNVPRRIAVVATPNDTFYNLQYYLDQVSDADIDANQAWQTTTGSRDVIIAVIDTGVDIGHADLAANIWTNPGEIAGNGIDDDDNGYVDDVNGWDFVEEDNDPRPTPVSGSYSTIMVVHGTHVSGIIGAVGNNGIGVTGVNWNVTIMPIRVFDELGESTAADLITAVNYAHNNGANIINMSYGGGSASVFEQEAIHAAYADGVLSIAAAGNESTNLNDYKEYPACYSEVLGVASLTIKDKMSSFSNYGDDCVDVSAAGSNIASTVYYDPAWGFDDEYEYLSGTSMATPVVSGVAGLVRSVDSGITSGELRRVLRSSADNLNDRRLGKGRVNARKALLELQKLDDPNTPNIKAYTSAQRKKTIAQGERTLEQMPYFHWKKPVGAYPVTGYYVAWGRRIKNPVKKGKVQTKSRYQPNKKIKGNGSKYYLSVKAVDANGNTSGRASFQYVIDTKVKRPTWYALTAATPIGAELRWNRPQREHIQGYHVYRSVDGDPTYAKLTSSLVTEERFIDISAQAGHTYSYKIRAYDDIGNRSTLSQPQSVSL